MNTFTQAHFKRAVFLLVLLLAGNFVYSQNGQYDVRMTLFEFDCNTNEVFVDVQVSASAPATNFLMTNQNYRVSFNKTSVNPLATTITNGDNDPANSVIIEEELDVSFFVSLDGTASFYSPHNLNGSLDSIVSYNIILAAGDGYPVTYNNWVSIGRLRFQVANPAVPLELEWHTQDPADFPPTFIGGHTDQGVPYEVAEGGYQDLTVSLSDLCGTNLPIELAYFKGAELDCAVALQWETFTEFENDYFLIEKSTDGLEFKTIARVEGQGTTNFPTQYSYIDRDVDVDNYYRLRQFDYDGTSTVSEQIVVRSDCFETDNGISISRLHPNPVSNRPAIIQFYSDLQEQEGQIMVTDVNGRVQLRKVVTIQPGANTLDIDVSSLPGGVYFAQLTGDGWFSSIQQFVKID